MTPKDIRKQLRNVVQEELKNTLLAEIKDQISRELQTQVQTKLTAIEDMVREKLESIDQRSKDTMGYLVRQVSKPLPDDRLGDFPAHTVTEHHE